jgi:hypothetical protein
VVAIKQTGAGKAQFPNGDVKTRTRKASDRPESVTLLRSSADSHQIVRFLKVWPDDVNIIVPVINGQTD